MPDARTRAGVGARRSAPVSARERAGKCTPSARKFACREARRRARRVSARSRAGKHAAERAVRARKGRPGRRFRCRGPSRSRGARVGVSRRGLPKPPGVWGVPLTPSSYGEMHRGIRVLSHAAGRGELAPGGRKSRVSWPQLFACVRPPFPEVKSQRPESGRANPRVRGEDATSLRPKLAGTHVS